MGIIYESNLKSLISSGKILPVYVFFGDDGYLINHYEKVIVDKTCGKNNDFDFQKFEKDIDLQAVFDSLNQFPMLGDRKCVVLSDYDFEAASAEDFERITSLLSDKYEFSTLVYKLEDIEFDYKHSSQAKKIIDTAEKGGGCVVELKHRDTIELSKMLISAAKKRNCILEMPTAKYMVETCGSDINTLSSEIDKLCLFVEGGKITESDIDNVCIKSVEASVYEYVKQIMSCNSSAAFNTLSDLLYMRFEPMLILYTTASAFVDIARVDAAKKSNKTNADIISDFPYKNKGFVIDRAMVNLKRFNDKKLSLCMNEIIKADKLLKSFSGDEKNILEQMTVKLIYIIANGDKVDTD